MSPRYGEGGMTRKGHLAIDVDRGVVVGDYPWASLDKDAEHGHSDESYECVYEAKFDEAEDQDKFLIFSQNLTNFQVGSEIEFCLSCFVKGSEFNPLPVSTLIVWSDFIPLAAV